MSTPPRMSERTPVRAPEIQPADDAGETSPRAKLAPLSDRLPVMSDHQLIAYQASAARIGSDPGHPKHATARKAIPKIEAEIKRRANELKPLKAK
jgi:hypothetical protein